MSNKSMENRGKFIKVAAVTAVLLTATALSFRHLHPRVEELQKPREAQVLFLPVYNGNQPNKIEVGATEGLRKWMKGNGFEPGKTEGTRETAERLNARIHAEKNMDIRQFAKVVRSEVDNDKREAVTADDMGKMNAPGCLEKSTRLASALLDMGVDARIFMVKHAVNGETVAAHMFVVAEMEGGKMMLDPFYGITETSLAGYKAKYLAKVEADVGKLPEGSEIAICMLPEYSPKYAQYAKGEKEQEVEEAFKAMK